MAFGRNQWGCEDGSWFRNGPASTGIVPGLCHLSLPQIKVAPPLDMRRARALRYSGQSERRKGAPHLPGGLAYPRNTFGQLRVTWCQVGMGRRDRANLRGPYAGEPLRSVGPPGYGSDEEPKNCTTLRRYVPDILHQISLWRNVLPERGETFSTSWILVVQRTIQKTPRMPD